MRPRNIIIQPPNITTYTITFTTITVAITMAG